MFILIIFLVSNRSKDHCKIAAVSMEMRCETDVGSVFCSAATREILLRLERFPHRLNFQKGLLESRKQTYRHLKYLLKPLPLETPTTIELAPGRKIRVTLFDANHCTGAVMFCKLLSLLNEREE